MFRSEVSEVKRVSNTKSLYSLAFFTFFRQFSLTIFLYVIFILYLVHIHSTTRLILNINAKLYTQIGTRSRKIRTLLTITLTSIIV